MKKWLGNLRMTRKLLVSPFAVMCFLAIFGAVCYWGFFKQKAALDDIYQSRFKCYRSSAGVLMGLREVHANVYKLMGWIGSNYDKARIESFTGEQFQQLKRVGDEIKGIAKSPGLAKEERDKLQVAATETLPVRGPDTAGARPGCGHRLYPHGADRRSLPEPEQAHG